MELQLQMFVQDRVGETTATNVYIGKGLMKLQLQKYVYERVDETTATNVCLGWG